MQGMLRSGERVIVGKGVLSGKIKDVKMGLKQLQEAQMRAYDKKANSVDPETVKPVFRPFQNSSHRSPRRRQRRFRIGCSCWRI